MQMSDGVSSLHAVAHAVALGLRRLYSPPGLALQIVLLLLLLKVWWPE